MYEVFDSLTPYEVAVLAFTCPRGDLENYMRDGIVILTAKEAYLWAGAIAHAVVRRPNFDIPQIKEMVSRAIMAEVLERSQYEALGATNFARSRGYSDTGVVDFFLREAGLWGERDTVYRRTDDAVRSLIWRGHIEDPFTKRIRGALVAVVFTIPVSFTSTGHNEVQINALTWEYAQQAEADTHARQFRVKVKELADVVMNTLVPAAVSAAERLSGVPEGHGLTSREVQLKLAQLGYYSGEIDGNVGPKTVEALRRYQRDHFLDVTGHLDPATANRLKAQ